MATEPDGVRGAEDEEEDEEKKGTKHVHVF